MFTTVHNNDDFPNMWDQIKRSNIDGVLMLDHGAMSPEIKIPCVRVDSQYTGDQPYHWVGSENWQGSCKLARTLYQAGHRHFAYVYDHQSHYTQIQRRNGFEAGLSKMSDQSIKLEHFYVPKLLDSQSNSIWQKLAAREDISAIVFVNDLIIPRFIRYMINHQQWPLSNAVLAGFGNLWETQDDLAKIFVPSKLVNEHLATLK